MDLTGKRIAILVDNMYEEMEAWYPYLRFQEAGAKLTVVAAEADQTYLGKHNYPMKSDLAYDAAGADQFDGVIIPGGFAPDRMRRYPRAVALVRDMAAQGKLVAAICHGPWMLCSANVLRGRRATSFFAIKDDVVNAGAIWEDAATVVDGSLVTSRTPADLPAFCKACLEVVAAVPVG